MSALRIAFHPIYAHSLPEGHRFPMLKYELIPQQLLYEGIIIEDDLFSPQPCADDVVLLTHTPAYVARLKDQALSAKEQRRIGFPQSPALTAREWIITQGTIDCCYHAMENGVALNVAGGTHHAFADRGEGFCLLNDFAVAANHLLAAGKIRKALVVDLDVHQGNGTAKIFEGNEAVYTFSMHGKNNYPFVKEQSDLDVELPDGIEDGPYLDLLVQYLPALIENVKPDIAFYVAGADILETDKFGKLKVTLNGCRQRDEIVFSLFKNAGVPCVVAMGGGYSPQVRTIVDAHCNTFRVAKKIFDLH